MTTCQSVWSSNTPVETITITASRQPQFLKDITSSISVVSEQELTQIQAVHSSELLARSAAVWISRGNGQEQLTAIRSPVLTGAGSCGAFYIAEDGVPVRPSGFCNVNQLFDVNTEQAQQIEVLKGPGTALHGSNALHGVINVISKPPSQQAEQLLSIEGGAYDYGRLKYSASFSHGQHGLRISTNASHDGGYKDDSGYGQQKLSLRHDHQYGSVYLRTLLSFSNLNQETAGYVTGLNAYKNTNQKTSNPNPEAYRDSRSARIQTRIETQLDNDGRVILTPFLRYSEMDFLMHFLPGTPTESNGQRSGGLQSAYSRPLSDALSLTNGIDIEYTQAYLTQSQTRGFSVFPEGKQYDYDVDARVYAVFTDANYTISDATRLSVGARYESTTYRYDNQMIDGDSAQDGSVCVNPFTGAQGCRYSRPADRSDSFHNWSFSAGLIHHISAPMTFVGRLAHGFRAPQATELYRLQAGQLQADLDSVEIDSIELGIRANYEKTNYSMTAFYMKKNNVIFQNSQRRNVDDGQTVHYGVEYQFSRRFFHHWTLSASGSYARHRYSKNASLFGSDRDININGNDIDTAPRLTGTVRLNWSITPQTLTELEWVHMDDYYTDIDNLHRYEGHLLTHFRLRHQLSSTTSLGLRINNLTNKDYAHRADFSTFSGDRYFIGEPRSVFLDISLKL